MEKQRVLLSKVIVIDGRMVSDIPHGIARYVAQIARGLKSLGKLEYRPVFLVHPQLSHASRQMFFEGFDTQEMQAPFLSPREWLEIPLYLRRSRAAAYHSPSFSSLWYSPCPTLMTLHDLNHLHFGDLSKKIYYQTLLKHCARRSAKVLTVSQFSQTEIARWLGVPPTEIAITYNAVSRVPLAHDSPLNPFLLKKYSLPDHVGDYFFCLSNSKPHKNLKLLLDAYREFRTQIDYPWPLLLSGSPLAPLPEGVYCLGALPEEDAHTFLKRSRALLFPSLYEGFGLPPVEGALLGLPLAVSHIPPHQEGLADLRPDEVHWVEPSDTKGWIRAFHVLQQHGVQGASVETQQRILARFSPEALGAGIDRIYRQVLGLRT